ncbi:hypothetical protein BaRGS_00009754 [Batillaria attramentaria]|uniref:Cytochrome b5 heme-binding domain-containing protein n=1 Tax=Batillaria attramentaria TaxID=370345 RepID=A0ABD0LHR3_9CAEN
MTTLVQTAPVQITNIHDTENVPPTFTRRDVMKHCDSDSCWIIVEDKVYDVTRFLRQHPGGDDIILEYAGHDASAAFWDKGHSNDAHRMLREYYIGGQSDDMNSLMSHNWNRNHIIRPALSCRRAQQPPPLLVHVLLGYAVRQRPAEASRICH